MVGQNLKDFPPTNMGFPNVTRVVQLFLHFVPPFLDQRNSGHRLQQQGRPCFFKSKRNLGKLDQGKVFFPPEKIFSPGSTPEKIIFPGSTREKTIFPWVYPRKNYFYLGLPEKKYFSAAFTLEKIFFTGSKIKFFECD